MTKKCKRRFTAKEKRELRKWAKEHGASFTLKEYNSMVNRVMKGCK